MPPATARIVIAGFLLHLLISESPAQQETLRKKHFNIEKDVALNGYDPVSYFSGHPVKGRSALPAVYKGITYYFSSPENAALFRQDPQRYEPQFGGWCAYAMGATAEKVEVDPETFKIVDSKLYVFYNRFFNNTLHDWNKDEVRLKRRAHENWAKIVAGP